MAIAAGICVYTNTNVVVEMLESGKQACFPGEGAQLKCAIF